MRFSSDAQRKAVFANMSSSFNLFSRDDVRVKKTLQDLESGIINTSEISNEELNDIDDYLSESEESYEMLRQRLREIGPSTVMKMGPYTRSEYKATMINKPIVAMNVVTSIGRTLTDNDIREFDSNGRLSDAAFGKAFRYYRDNFGDDYELNRGRFEAQVDKMLTSRHGRSAVDALIKGGSEFAKKSDAVVRNEILVESLLNEYDFEDDDKNLLRPILKARGEKLGFTGTDTTFGLDDFDLGLLLDAVKMDEKVAQDFARYNYMHKYFKDELQVTPEPKPLKSKKDDISSYKTLTSFETSKKSKPWDQKTERIAVVDGEYYTPLTSFAEDEK